MKENHKKLFRYYIYGYLNCYYNSMSLVGKGQSYKQYKFREILNYLKIRANNSVMEFVLLKLSHCENLISFILTSCYFIRELCKLLFAKKCIMKDKFVFYDNDREMALMLKSSDLNPQNIVAVKNEFGRSYTNIYHQVSLSDGLSYKNVVEAYFLSVRMIFLMKRKYGNRDFFFRSYSSFEYFLLSFFVENLPNCNTFCFDALIDRWAFLGGNQDIDTIFLQHGLVSPQDKDCIFLKKIGKVTFAYYINENQKDVCEKFLFTNKPIAKYLSGFVFSSNNVLLKNGKINVLLICNYVFFDKEKAIIESIAPINTINLYVKPHPKDDLTPYKELKRIHDFVILGTVDYPKVDVVISCNSTLGVKYESCGVKVLWYDNMGIDSCVEYIRYNCL